MAGTSMGFFRFSIASGVQNLRSSLASVSYAFACAPSIFNRRSVRECGVEVTGRLKTKSAPNRAYARSEKSLLVSQTLKTRRSRRRAVTTPRDDACEPLSLSD